MKKILTKTALVGAVGLAAFSSQKVSAADEVQVDANVSSSESSSTSTSVSAPNDTLNLTDSSTATENNTNTTEVPATTPSVKENENVGPGYYTSNNSTVAAVTTKSYLLKSSESFIAGIKSGLISGWEKYGVLPSVSAAQAILESGWGSSGLAIYGNNLFGIKGTYNGAYVTMPTQEYINGQWITINAQFRKYPSWNESVEDHGYFLASNSRYSNLLGVTDYKKVTSLLQQDGYATAPTYASALNSIIEQNNLTAIDDEAINKSSNVGVLDSKNVSSSNLLVSGWHTAKEASNKPYSYLFVMDADTNKEIKRIRINRTQRSDVQSVYPNIPNSLNSGFNNNIPIDQSMAGKNIKIMSRYSADPNGNYDSIDYEYDDTVKMPEGKASSLDSVTYTKGMMNIRGWYADNDSVGKANRYLIVLDAKTDKEITRQRLSTVNRPDVAAVCPQIAGSGQSGFAVSVPLNENLYGKDVKFIIRYSSDFHGNDVAPADTSFTYKVKNTENVGFLEAFRKNGDNQLYVHGWHAADLTSNKPYSYLIVLDATNNRELGRYSMKRTNNRSDVQNAFPAIANAQSSGFDAFLQMNSSMKGKRLKIISRYSDDPRGNGNFVDYWYQNNVIKG